jgi:hypothetical protein
VLASAVAAGQRASGDPIGVTVTADGRELPMPRWGVSVPTRGTTGDVAAMALYAGRSVAAVERVQTAAEVVAELAAGLRPT